MLAFGEVQTGLLQNSTALSRERTLQALSFVTGENVRHSARPIAHAVSADRLDSIDCLLPTASRGHIRGVGTLASHATIVGGQVAQGSTYATVLPSAENRRMPWSHYLAGHGQIETIGKFRRADLMTGLLRPDPDESTLDTSAITGRMLDTIQRSAALDRKPPLRAPRTRLRWVASLQDEATAAAQPGEAFTVVTDELRTLRLTVHGGDLDPVVALCEDLALHDWLLTTLLSILDTALTSNRSRNQRILRLRPAVDHLLHLWMPAARVGEELRPVWEALERQPGFSRQWDASVTRIRDQVTMSTLALLESPAD
jgi:hypothetical protein